MLRSVWFALLCLCVFLLLISLCRLVAMSVELKLSRSNRIFRPNEPLEGKIITKLPSSISHNGIRLTVNGSVTLQVRGGSAGVIESLYGVLKPIPIVNKSIEVRSSGRIGSGTTEIPFSVILKHPGDDNLERFYETFHGGNVSIQYLVTVDIVRGYLHKSLSATVEFIIESEKASLPDQPVSPELVIFYITQDTQRHSLLPELRSGGFRVTGKIGTQCSLSDPLKGELTVEASAVPIHSIDIHLLRVESILVGERIITETSLIQTTQIADGDVCHNITLPIYIILPRLLTCPTIYAGPFSIEFKVSIVITFQSELLKLNPKSDPRMPRLWLAMESVPLELIRTK
ncbi:Down syndrome critical region protein 3 homolog isoform X1 [Camellia sinensis]|uniref:Down syndrome critical region protein 3 homolog isoform X1 n=1 Tax=Camellia sinensis TaxID=4442 RepID=UPI001035EB1A|nr:Down syndrome critical region protein 3 homolog isoform X1 [Camellia sinensis]XP_028059861.1 Down syndrome critical region protein 3 homolog isoform X1 [Camellia sinensis]